MCVVMASGGYPGVLRQGQSHFGSGRGGQSSGRLCVSCRHRSQRRKGRYQRGARSRGYRRGERNPRGDRDRLSGRGQDHLGRGPIPPGYRPESPRAAGVRERGRPTNDEKNEKPLVAILMGSDSDLPVMEEAAKILAEFRGPLRNHRHFRPPLPRAHGGICAESRGTGAGSHHRRRRRRRPPGRRHRRAHHPSGDRRAHGIGPPRSRFPALHGADARRRSGRHRRHRQGRGAQRRHSGGADPGRKTPGLKKALLALQGPAGGQGG